MVDDDYVGGLGEKKYKTVATGDEMLEARTLVERLQDTITDLISKANEQPLVLKDGKFVMDSLHIADIAVGLKRDELIKKMQTSAEELDDRHRRVFFSSHMGDACKAAGVDLFKVNKLVEQDLKEDPNHIPAVAFNSAAAAANFLKPIYDKVILESSRAHSAGRQPGES